MRTNTANRPRARLLLVLVAVMAILAIAPVSAGAMTVSQSSLRPNGLTGVGVFGGKATRLTWELKLVHADPTVSSVDLMFPQGTDLTKATVTVITLKGLQRSAVHSTTNISGNKLTLTFAPSIEPTANLRVAVEDVVLPAAGGTFQITGVLHTAAGTSVAVPGAVEPLTVRSMTLAERWIDMLDHSAMVAKWNSVRFLNMFFKPQLIVASIFLEFRGWLVSMFLVLVGFPLAIPIGLMLAFAKMSKVAPLRWISSFYVNIIRGTPLFLQIYIAFFGLPLIGIQANKFVLGIIVLALNSSAYLTEIFRAGIQSIHRGQFEAASSLGMTYPQAMQYVIIPQTVKRILPTMTSEFILLYKDTALLSAVGVFELMMFSKNLTANTGNVTPYIVAAFYYLLVTTPLIRYVQTLERRLAVAEGGAAASDTTKRRWPWQPATAGPESALLASSVEHESR